MKHLGDITKISGYDVPIVDIVVGGSPCQDLSVAGKRAGLDGERSGLFMEQIRIIKEMREHDRADKGTDVDFRFLRPRYMVWENVPGAFSSNKGEDFRCVLEETAKIVSKDTIIPEPYKNKWTPSGCIMGDGWSIAWRVHDAQFWGVPQRRKRIALIADFGGLTAPEILFEHKGLSGHIEESGSEREGTAGDVEGSLGASSYTLKVRGGREIDSYGKRAGKGALVQTELSGTLGVSQDQTLITKCLNPWDVQSKHIQPEDGIAEALYAGECSYAGGESNVLQTTYQSAASFYPQMKAESQCFRDDDVSVTLVNGTNPGYQNGIVQPMSMQRIGEYKESEQASSLKQRDYKDATDLIVYGLDRAAYNQGANAQYDFRVEEEKIGTQVAKGPGAVFSSVVRRLTPKECERLQGYPDGWTDIGDWTDSKGKKHKGESDSPRYKALGNSIALPFWQWMAERMCKYLDEPTMASLFDGIGGFPLVFSRCGCRPIWASEIEEFPIAVTKIRFPDNLSEGR